VFEGEEAMLEALEKDSESFKVSTPGSPPWHCHCTGLTVSYRTVLTALYYTLLYCTVLHYLLFVAVQGCVVVIRGEGPKGGPGMPRDADTYFRHHGGGPGEGEALPGYNREAADLPGYTREAADPAAP